MVERSVIRAKVVFIQTRLRELTAQRKMLPVALFREDINAQAVVLHHFQVVIQACCDVASHIIADQELGVPGSSVELFEILAQAKIISWPLAERFGRHVRLRNRIVHGYSKLDYADIFGSLPERVRDISNFLRRVVSTAKL